MIHHQLLISSSTSLPWLSLTFFAHFRHWWWIIKMWFYSKYLAKYVVFLHHSTVINPLRNTSSLRKRDVTPLIPLTQAERRRAMKMDIAPAPATVRNTSETYAIPKMHRFRRSLDRPRRVDREPLIQDYIQDGIIFRVMITRLWLIVIDRFIYRLIVFIIIIDYAYHSTINLVALYFINFSLKGQRRSVKRE